MAEPTSDRVPGSSAPDLRVRTVVHDVNQLLWVILGQASLWEHDPAAPPAVARIAAAARDASALLRGLLGDEAIVADPGACDVGDVVRLAWRQSHDLVAARTGASVVGTLASGDGPPSRLAVPELVARRILANLFTNALEAGGAQAHVVCSWREHEGDVMLDVADDGPGMAPDLAASIFTAGVSTKGGGHGIGLAGCRQLARDHGGDLTLVRAGAKGTVFRLTLPLVGEAINSRRLRVLAVDDEVSVRDMLRDCLEAEGHTVVVASAAADALAGYDAGSADVVLVDLRLPGRSGLEVAAELRRCDPAVAVILMTGWGSEAASGMADDPAIDFMCTKPLDLPRLLVLLQRAGVLCARRREQ